MLGLTCISNPPIPIPIPIPIPVRSTLSFPSSLLKTQSHVPRNLTRFVVAFAETNNGFGKDPKEGEQKQKQEQEQEQEIGSNGGGGDDDDSGKDRRPIFNIRWSDLLNPEPDNLVAIGLTGLLTWASVQVLWQLFFISFAILVAALKYSFIAALLIFILITLL